MDLTVWVFFEQAVLMFFLPSAGNLKYYLAEEVHRDENAATCLIFTCQLHFYLTFQEKYLHLFL